MVGEPRFKPFARRFVGLGHYLPVLKHEALRHHLSRNQCRKCRFWFPHRATRSTTYQDVYSHSCALTAFDAHPLNHSQYAALLNSLSRRGADVQDAVSMGEPTCQRQIATVAQYADCVCDAKVIPPHHILRRIYCNSYPELGIKRKRNDQFKVSVLMLHELIWLLVEENEIFLKQHKCKQSFRERIVWLLEVNNISTAEHRVLLPSFCKFMFDLKRSGKLVVTKMDRSFTRAEYFKCEHSYYKTLASFIRLPKKPFAGPHLSHLWKRLEKELPTAVETPDNIVDGTIRLVRWKAFATLRSTPAPGAVPFVKFMGKFMVTEELLEEMLGTMKIRLSDRLIVVLEICQKFNIVSKRITQSLGTTLNMAKRCFAAAVKLTPVEDIAEELIVPLNGDSVCGGSATQKLMSLLESVDSDETLKEMITERILPLRWDCEGILRNCPRKTVALLDSFVSGSWELTTSLLPLFLYHDTTSTLLGSRKPAWNGRTKLDDRVVGGHMIFRIGFHILFSKVINDKNVYADLTVASEVPERLPSLGKQKSAAQMQMNRLVDCLLRYAKYISGEVLFTYFMALISRGLLDEAELLQKSLLGSQLKSSWKSTLDLYTNGYRGMIAYYEWKKLFEQHSRPSGIDAISLTQQMRMYEESWDTLQQVQSDILVNDAASKAARLLAEAVSRVPNCELFFEKLCDILQVSGSRDDLNETLEVYHARNPENLAGIQHLHKVDPHDESHLVQLARLSPGHPLVLNLCQLRLEDIDQQLIDNQRCLEILNLFGEYLDLRRNKSDMRAWEGLQWVLEFAVRMDLHYCLMDFGKRRKTYWRKYHFHVGLAEFGELERVKLSVWKLLEDFW